MRDTSWVREWLLLTQLLHFITSQKNEKYYLWLYICNRQIHHQIPYAAVTAHTAMHWKHEELNVNQPPRGRWLRLWCHRQFCKDADEVYWCWYICDAGIFVWVQLNIITHSHTRVCRHTQKEREREKGTGINRIIKVGKKTEQDGGEQTEATARAGHLLICLSSFHTPVISWNNKLSYD